MPATDVYPQDRSVASPDSGAGWLAGIQARNQDALEKIYRRYNGEVIRFLSLVDPDQSPAEACLEVFERLWHGAAAAPPNDTLVDCIFHLAYQVVLERARSADPTGRAEPIPSPRFDVRSLVEGLNREQRVIVALVYAIGLPLDSISRITTMTDKEIVGHLGKARDRLRPELMLARSQ